MHGLILVTWEQYLADRFGEAFLARYRKELGETASNAPLTTRLYDDATLLAGLSATRRLSGCTADDLLRGYGHHFLLNGLTSHLCAALLRQVDTARDLLLLMRQAHRQLGTTATQVTPPLFRYEAIRGDPRGLRLLYDSPRQLCAVLWGAIEGAAERYQERVWIEEPTCMKQGAVVCTFDIHFHPRAGNPPREETDEQRGRRLGQRDLADVVYRLLPEEEGLTLGEVRQRVQQQGVSPQATRPLFLVQALNQLHYAGWVTSTAYQDGDALASRRYWRLPPAHEP